MPISADALVKAGMPDIQAREVVTQMTTATPNVGNLMRLGMPQTTAVELGAQIGSGTYNAGRLVQLAMVLPQAQLIAAGP